MVYIGVYKHIRYTYLVKTTTLMKFPKTPIITTHGTKILWKQNLSVFKVSMSIVCVRELLLEAAAAVACNDNEKAPHWVRVRIILLLGWYIGRRCDAPYGCGWLWDGSLEIGLYMKSLWRQRWRKRWKHFAGQKLWLLRFAKLVVTRVVCGCVYNDGYKTFYLYSECGLSDVILD